jgi:hypothetical protein
MQSTTSLTIQILLNEPLTTEPALLVDGTRRLLASKELYKLNPVVFFPVCAGGHYTQYIVSREYTIDINDNSILIRTDFVSIRSRQRRPNYGAIWILSEDRKTLTYSHTEEDL